MGYQEDTFSPLVFFTKFQGILDLQIKYFVTDYFVMNSVSHLV